MKPEDKEISVSKVSNTEPLPGELIPVEVGQWYWLKDEDDKKSETLCCVMHVGTNFAMLTEAGTEYDQNHRVHFKDFLVTTRREMNPETVIRSMTEHYQQIVRAKLGQIKEVTARLGISDHLKIEQKPVEESTRALSVLSGTDNVRQYKKDLVKAQTKTLPKLFKDVEEANKSMTWWMKAQALPAQAMAGGLKGVIGEIEGRIFNVSLYAGLTEEVVQLTDGEPAALTEKLRLVQRLCFMDEEALIGYQHGGMEFSDIAQFDYWITRPENMERILHYPRCMVAFRVRRNEKYRDPEAFGSGLGAAFVIAHLKELDELTFLYIRNGQRVYRMNCDLDFDTKIFPSKSELNLNEPMMIGKFVGVRDDLLITKREYDVLVEKEAERKAKCEEWRKANPRVPWIKRPSWVDDSGPFYRLEDYEPFDKSSVYFDDTAKLIANRVKYYNRIALIIQGLYDRSEVLHPHPPYQLWKSEGFETAVELIYDASNILEHGEAPDFKRYWAECNAALKKGSVTLGQDDFWELHEGGKANARSYHNRETVRYRPYGNKGPGFLSEVAEWNEKKREAAFCWEREFQGWWRAGYYGPKKRGDLVPASIKVPADKLFCVSGYRLGDYRKFFADPRTREHYLSWAPLLLTAEEFHAGNLDAQGALKKKNKMPKLKRLKAKQKGKK